MLIKILLGMSFGGSKERFQLVKKILNRLYFILNQYSTDDLYRFVDLTEEDKNNFENLRNTLREVGLGLNKKLSTTIKKALN